MLECTLSTTITTSIYFIEFQAQFATQEGYQNIAKSD